MYLHWQKDRATAWAKRIASSRRVGCIQSGFRTHIQDAHTETGLPVLFDGVWQYAAVKPKYSLAFFLFMFSKCTCIEKYYTASWLIWFWARVRSLHALPCVHIGFPLQLLFICVLLSLLLLLFNDYYFCLHEWNNPINCFFFLKKAMNTPAISFHACLSRWGMTCSSVSFNVKMFDDQAMKLEVKQNVKG